MDGIYEPNDTFMFDKLILTKPTIITGGNYFIKFLANDNPLYIQPPKCKLKQGISKSGKRLFADLMFTNENDQFIRWMENLENHSQQKIFNNREQWFDGEMEMADIENYFTSPLKVYKSGKYYIIRTNITTMLGKSVLKIYDENENEVDMDNINENMNIMTILEIQGIKCSARSFQIEIELKQMLVMNPVNIFDKCLLTKKPHDSIANASHITNEMEKSEEQSNVIYYTEPNSKDNEDEDIIISHTNSSENEIKEEINEEINEELNEETKEPLEKTIMEPIAPLHVSNEQSVSGTPNNTFSQDEQLNVQPCISDNEIKIQNSEIHKSSNGLEEVEFQLDELRDTETIQIKQRNEVYYEMYREARRKAKIARNLALSSYLEAKRIKNTYMLEDLKDSDDSDLDINEDFEDNENNEN